MKRIVFTAFLVLLLVISSASPVEAATVRKTRIIGAPRITAEQMERFVHSINPSAPYLAQIFLDEGRKEGIRGDIAFAQSLRETGYFRFGNMVLAEQNNFAGLGATNATPKGKGAWFATPEEGVRAQIQHLKAYANSSSLRNPLVDPRFHLVKRGSAPYWEDLNGRWAVPGKTYGQDILKMYNKIRQF